MVVSVDGGCFCGSVRYHVELTSSDEAHGSLCHCRNCKKAYGGGFMTAVKIPISCFSYSKGNAKVHAMDNGSGVLVTREFCDMCGSSILEYPESTKETHRFITLGTLDDPTKFEPVYEIFTKDRLNWVSPVPGARQRAKL
ncbi:uncharacterized protein I206_104511 [Kwoniella pini CBS 10737]|uniref:CENP-V/GFA domain-containing protein n=1 Tax=Kwoniella pini CBS 10737 TaxID=1296096 RepID=A0A1B9I703_9TREE|nr:uncharacterized protein I206_02042 [Kwoniella pini CBS 10737]OCF51328.1 hypothetical protein I206_02042 [Kwoniella pini CBS 10737]